MGYLIGNRASGQMDYYSHTRNGRAMIERLAALRPMRALGERLERSAAI